MSFTIFDFQTRVIFGAGSLIELGKEARGLGRQALLVTTAEILKAGLVDRVLKDLEGQGVETVLFAEVESNPRSATVDRGAGLARRENVDLVIGLGGGSAVDAAKAVALASADVHPVWRYAESKIVPHHPVPPLIQVPTLAGTGAEISRGAVITNWETHIKKSIISPLIQARVAIIDPELTLTVPEAAARAGAVDAFSHAVEPYLTSEVASPITDGIRETIMKTILEYLPRMIDHPQDIEVREQLSWSAMLAMSQIARLGGGGGFMPCHSLGHALSGYYNISHGDSLAALLPAWMSFTRPAKQARFKQLGMRLFGREDSIGAFQRWLEQVGMRLRLEQLGFEPAKAGEVAAIAVRTSAGLAHNPVPVDVAAAAQIYRDSL